MAIMTSVAGETGDAYLKEGDRDSAIALFSVDIDAYNEVQNALRKPQPPVQPQAPAQPPLAPPLAAKPPTHIPGADMPVVLPRQRTNTTDLDKVTLNNEKIAGFNLASAHEAQNRLIEHIIRKLNAGLKKLEHKEVYGAFFDGMVRHKLKDQTNSVISLNWDTLPDYYINKGFKKSGVEKGGVDYGCFDWDFEDKECYVSSILRRAKGYETGAFPKN
jgi:hypothetical protein